jgi:hypothetical protein
LRRLTHALTAISLLAAASVGCGSSGGSTKDAGHDGSPSDGSPTDGASDGGSTDGGGDTSVACVTGGTGQLVVNVQGLPTGAMPMIRVVGGSLTAPMVVAPGTPVTVGGGGGYMLEYRRVKVAPAPGGIVGKAYYPNADAAAYCVKAGATTTATLTYMPEPGSEHLWIGVANAPTADNQIAAFKSADVAATGAKNPDIWKTKHFGGRPAAGAFDSFGNFWVPGGDVVNMYSMAKLATPGDVAPDVVLTQPANSPALFAAFDANGNLWISRGAPANTVVRYNANDLGASGSPTPDVVLSGSHLMNPAGLAFAGSAQDPASSQDLWVASEGNGEVVSYHRERLTASTSDAPDVVLTAKAGGAVPTAYAHPNGIAFDQAGNLWVGFEGVLVAFTGTQQGTSAAVAAPLAVNISTGTGGFAFDESGGVWMAGNVGTFQRVSKAALMTGGDVTPDIVITSSDLGYAESLVLDPSPTWSPLHDWL